MERNLWLVFVLIAGMAWGTYVPIIFYGGSELTTKPGTIGGRLASILCVGIAYFVLAVVIPVALMATRDDAKPDWKVNGLVFSGLAGVMGAVGAICVIFASKAAVDAAREAGAQTPQELAKYRMFIGPLIFGLAPVINTLVSAFWHPEKGNPFVFKPELPGWKLWVGILLVGIGAALVLFSKEEAEAKPKHGAAKAPPTTTVTPAAHAATHGAPSASEKPS